jgi:hypothetical protein
LEELLPKDNETIPLPLDGPLLPSEPQGFSAAQMVRCEECLRANAPTRVSCLYCGTALPATAESAKLRKPTLRQPEKHEPGFNSVLLKIEHNNAFAEAANLLKLPTDKLQEIIETKQQLPLARTASLDEAELVCERLQDLGIKVLTLSDADLGVSIDSIVRPRSFTIADETITVHQGGSRESIEVEWTSLHLIVLGRLVVSKVEVQERMSRKAENEILDTSQFFSDELVFDLYSTSFEQTWRVGANSFDFSCLENEKTLVSGQNIKRLAELIASRASGLKVDNSYAQLRTQLQVVWPMDHDTFSQGWRRQRPGKISLGAITVNSNETQFTRYSRLLRYFSLNPHTD